MGNGVDREGDIGDATLATVIASLTHTPTVVPTHTLTVVPTHTPTVVPTHTPTIFPFWGFHSTSANWEAFGVAFWSGLFYSAIVTVLAGIIVGILVERYQRRMDKARTRREDEEAVARFKSNLRMLADQPLALNLQDISTAIAGDPAPILAALGDSALPRWRHTCPDQRAFFALLDSFQARRGKLVRLASEAEKALKLTLSEYAKQHPNDKFAYDPAAQDRAGRYWRANRSGHPLATMERQYLEAMHPAETPYWRAISSKVENHAPDVDIDVRLRLLAHVMCGDIANIRDAIVHPDKKLYSPRYEPDTPHSLNRRHIRELMKQYNDDLKLD